MVQDACSDHRHCSDHHPLKVLGMPPFLQEGDTIGIVATARKISFEEAAPAIGMLVDEGFKVRTGQRMFGVSNQFSGTDEERAADLQRMLDDPEVKAIFCARGGYGTVRIIDRLDFTEFVKHPKWICGFSDVTVLHSHIHRHFGMATLHSSMLFNMRAIQPDHASFRTLVGALKGEFPSLQVPSTELNRLGTCEAEVVGGNLSILYSLLGSDSDIETDGKILFLEDLDEYLYHLDRMMMNLSRNGKLDRLAGLIVGGMTDMNDNAVAFGETAEQIIARHAAAFDYPVAFGFPVGHLDENHALIFGKKAALRISEGGCELRYV
jgi:muramoyltetrapeptide carboxypeptidase